MDEGVAHDRAEANWLERIASDFTREAWVFIPIAVTINVAGSFVVDILGIPLFFNVIGTIALAIVSGPWVAAVAGASTNVVLGLLRAPFFVPFGLVQVGIALVVGYLATRGWFRVRKFGDHVWLVATGLLVAATAVVISTPIIVLVFGDLTGGPADVVIEFFLVTWTELLTAVLVAEFVYEPIDKIVSVFVAYFIATSIPRRYLPPFGRRTLTRE
ncbi:hypothetical protein [Natrinema caseinilyticum]|uniref:hypothetical protein n=1 Tax=Natrinema caseinilyticum TaxID=2961570 RepID=UPI0020C23D7C|nr:hypothetical protein [Natrinema caseinilyticum]